MDMARHVKRIIFALLILISGTSSAATLSATESAALRADIASLMAHFEAGDTDALVTRSHRSLAALAGGQQAYAEMTRKAMEEILAKGIRFVSSELGEPTPTYPAGDEEVCFVPRVAVVEVDGKRMRSLSFMVAIRSVAGGPWSYLDGSGLKDRPEMLYKLLPSLQPGVELPPNTIEQLP